MKLSEELKAIKTKYESNEVVLTPCSVCKNSYRLTNECLKCSLCGRKFDEQGNLIEEADLYAD